MRPARRLGMIGLMALLAISGCQEGPKFHPDGGSDAGDKGGRGTGGASFVGGGAGSGGSDAGADLQTPGSGGQGINAGVAGGGGAVGSGGVAAGVGNGAGAGRSGGGLASTGGVPGGRGGGAGAPGENGSGSGGITGNPVSTGGVSGTGGSPSCTAACVPGAVCNMGACACATAGQTMCSDGCVDLQTDKSHCGSCTRSCPDGCSAGRCFTALSWSPVVGDMHIAVNSDYVFFTNPDEGTVSSVSRKGEAPPRVIAASQDRPVGIAVDSSNVYWVNQGSGDQGSVMKMSLSGGSPVSLATGESYPQEIAIDATNVYWSNYLSRGSVVKVPIAGGTKVVLAADPNMVNTFAMAIDGTNAYWTNLGDPEANNGSVMKVPLGGGPLTTLASNMTAVHALAVYNGTVYFGGWGKGQSVLKVGINGGALSTVMDNTFALALAFDATNLFVADLTGANYTITQVPLAGTARTTLVREGPPSGNFHLLLDAGNVFWTTLGTIRFTSKAP